MALGTGIALLPETRVRLRGGEGARRAPRRDDAVLLMLLLLPARCPRAARRDPAAGGAAAADAAREEICGSEIICMCGTCGRKRIGECTCARAAQMRAEVAQLLAQGKTATQVYAVLHRASTAARNRWRRRSTGLQPPGVAVPVPDRRIRRADASASWRCAGRAATHEARRPTPAPAAGRDPALEQGWTMSSATSIETRMTRKTGITRISPIRRFHG